MKIILITLFFFTSCGKVFKGPKDSTLNQDPKQYSWSEPIKAPQNYSIKSATIGLSICKALREKRERYMGRRDQSIRHFITPFTKSCDSSRPFQGRTVTATVRNIRNRPLYFEPSRNSDPILEEIITDETVKLEPLCANLLRGNLDISNTVRRGGVVYQVFFFQEGEKQYLNIIDFEEGEGGLLFPYQQDIAGILTSTSTVNSQLLGVTFIRTKNEKCDNGQTSYLQQKTLF